MVLIESDQLGSGASGACEGNILVSDKSPGPELDLARRSLTLYAGLKGRLDADVELERKGGLLVAASAGAETELVRQGDWMRGTGLDAELLDPATACEAEPVLRPDIAGALLVADDLQVCPLKLVVAYALAATRLGARVVQGCMAVGIECSGERVTGLRTNRGHIACTSVVVAAGVPSRDLLRPLGLDLPLTGRRGQILVSSPMPGLITRKVYDFGYRATVVDRDPRVRVAVVLETTRRGNVLIGASREFRETSRESDIEVDVLLAERALEFAPGLAGIKILRSYAGIRPTLPDELPAIGPVPGVDGAWLACGHEGAGIGLAPATAEMIGGMLAGGETPVEPRSFRPDRFMETSTTPAGAGTR